LASRSVMGRQPAARPLLEGIPRLVDKSMVVAETGGGGIRYRLLETVREYALERLFGVG